MILSILFFFFYFSEREAGSARLVSTSRNRSSPTSTLQQPDEIEGTSETNI